MNVITRRLLWQFMAQATHLRRVSPYAELEIRVLRVYGLALRSRGKGRCSHLHKTLLKSKGISVLVDLVGALVSTLATSGNASLGVVYLRARRCDHKCQPRTATITDRRWINLAVTMLRQTLKL